MVVSRAEFKLEDAIKAWGFSFRDKTVLDIGSSTGGFTECALKNGAKSVIAIEKGTKQMHAPLRFDSRINLHEKTDIFSITKILPDLFKSEQIPTDIILADVSFVSLEKILSFSKRKLARRGTNFLVKIGRAHV